MSPHVRSVKMSAACSILSSLLLGSLLTGTAAPLRAETAALELAQTPVAAALPKVDSCAPLVAQLRWHEPFFGTREWREVAQEALSYASPACRAALSTGQADEVAAALSSLEQRAGSSDPQLARFVYRVSCQLRVSSLRQQIFAGTQEPGVYVDCVDAVFALGWTDPQSNALRERYLDGLAKEPLTTPIPPSTLTPPYVERLAPVVAAYDTAKKPRRDVLFHALCVRNTPKSDAAKTVCLGVSVREPGWAKESLEKGNISDGISYLATLSGEQLPQFLPLLHRFDSERRRGRDRMHRMLCQQRLLAAPELLPACQTLAAEMEPRWAHQAKTQEINDELTTYHRVAYGVGQFLGVLSLLIIGHALLINRRRALAELNHQALQIERGIG